MSTIRVVNLQHTDATEPNIVLEADGTAVFASGITISGETSLTVSGTAEFASGTVSAPGITFIDDNNTGIYSPGADQVAVATNGSGRFFIDANGKVEVSMATGSSSITPTELRISSTTDANDWDTTNPWARLGFYSADTTNGARTRAAIDVVQQFSNGNVSAFSFKTDNGSGIPTLVERQRISYTGTTTLTSAAATEPLIVNIDASEVARIDSSGRLLVGTSSAVNTQWDANLQVVGTDTPCSFVLARNDATVAADITVAAIRVFGNDSNGTYEECARIAAVSDGDHGDGDKPTRLVFSTTADGASSTTERMRITNGGFVLVGTDSINPHSAATESSRGIALRRDAGILVGVTDIHAGIFSRYGTDGECLRFQKDLTDVGSIDVTPTSTTYNTSSDHRLKENVVDIADGITRVKQLQPKRFNFIADADTTVDGFIAHEAQAVVPECVTGTKDEVDDDGNPIYQGIDQSRLVPLLTAALQEAVAKIESLEARLTAAGI